MQVEMVNGGLVIVTETEFESDYLTELFDGGVDIAIDRCDDCGKVNSVLLIEEIECDC